MLSEKERKLRELKFMLNRRKRLLRTIWVIFIIAIICIIAGRLYYNELEKNDEDGDVNQSHLNENSIQIVADIRYVDENNDNVVLINENITFDGTDSEPLESTFVWKFGDGSINDDNKSTVEHSYELPGDYNVNLTVSFEDLKDSEVITVQVVEELPPNIDLTIVPAAENQTNVLCRGFFSVSNISTTDQLRLDNFYIEIYKFNIGNHSLIFNSSLADLYPPSLNIENIINIEYMAGINFTDNPPLGQLTTDLDELLIAGDGGGYGVNEGDMFVLIYSPLDLKLDEEIIP
jgi:hypothetical protein